MWLNKAGTTLVSKTIPAVLVVILAKSASLLKVIKSTSGINGRKFVCALQNHYTQGTHGVSMIGIVAIN
jgi:hypothetical protein